MPTPSQYYLTIPSARRFLRDVRRFVEAHARNAGCSSDVVEHLKLAADEACTNIILHAYRGESDKTIEIAISHSNDEITISLKDHGHSFDWSTYNRPTDLRNSLNARRGGGWGIYMMQKLMDRIEYTTSDSSNEVRLTKILDTGPA